MMIEEEEPLAPVHIPVLKVHSCETKNYAVAYDSQVQHQVDLFRESSLNQ